MAATDTGRLLVPRRLSGSGPGLATPAAPQPAVPALWLVDTAEYRGYASRHAPGILDAQELAHAARFVRTADRDAYECAHVALRLLLGAYLGVAAREVVVERAPCAHCDEPHGRPVVPGGTPHFSLSHCEGLSLLAFATTPVGVDVEPVPDAAAVAEVADVLHPREAAELAGLPAAVRPSAFARVWTRKEAYLKGTGVGLSADPAADYVGAGPVPASPPGWTLYDVLAPEGHHAAVALADPSDDG
ncbi:4'-phosphopantetheinyl transferase superfamily protein [Streptomyces sp. NPDC006551]|uniref:4'-phosphopantetheinyl transferase family protein n=1 Tax=Streptomyces sp. NPDC006551 TaxID=3157178 RepID=UPI0033BCB644